MQEKAFLSNTVILSVMGVMVFVATVAFVGAYLTHSDTVDVSAEVTETVTCSTDTSSINFGTLSTGGISTSSDAITTVDCNPAAGCSLFVQDVGDTSGNAGLWNSTSSALIASQDETLTAGSEGYGIQAASSTNGSGGDLTVAAKYDVTGDTVGALTTNDTTIASSNEPVSQREITVSHLASISATTPSGQYQDTITYSCTAN